jgi:tetratricopeptide (TPR) repeat protein
MFQLPPLDNEDQFEDFICDLFNLEYDTDSFQRFGNRGHNQKGIDIFSAESQIVIQCKKKDIKRKDSLLVNELINDIRKDVIKTQDENLRIPFKRFILTSTFKNHPDIQEFATVLKKENSYSFEIEYWGWNTIVDRAIKHRPLIEKYYPHFLRNETYSDLTFFPAIDLTREFIGRENDIHEIFKSLKENSSLLIVNGIGGIGKSVVAKAFAEKYKKLYNHRVWIDIQSNDNDEKNDDFSLLSAFSNNYELVSSLGIAENSDVKPKDKFKNILFKLNQLKGTNLLVIDNVSQSINKYLSRLPKGENWHILLTSRERIVDVVDYELDTLNLDFSKQLFYSHYLVEKNDILLEEILKMIEFHTLTIELLAKTGKKRRLTIKELKSGLEDRGLQLSKSAKVFTSHDSEKCPTRLFDYLLKIFSLSGLQREHKEILNNFSIFPTVFVEYKELIGLLGVNPESEPEFFDTLFELVERGWIIEKDRKYRVHQVIQEVLRAKLEPSYEKCSTFIESVSKQLIYNFSDDISSPRKLIAYGEAIIKDLKMDRSHLCMELTNNLCYIYKEVGYFEKGLDLGLELLSLEKPSDLKYNSLWAEIYVNTGVCYRRLGDNVLARKQLFRAIEFLDASKNSKIQLAYIYSSIGVAYNKDDQYKDGLKYKKIALEIIEDVESEHPLKGTLHGNIAESYKREGLFNEAIPYHMKCIQYLEKHVDSKSSLYGISYCNFAVSLFELGLCNAAKNNMDKGIVVLELNNFKEHPDYKLFKPIQIEINKIVVLTNSNFFQEGLVHFKIKRNDPCYCSSGKKYKYCCGQ